MGSWLNVARCPIGEPFSLAYPNASQKEYGAICNTYEIPGRRPWQPSVPSCPSHAPFREKFSPRLSPCFAGRNTYAIGRPVLIPGTRAGTCHPPDQPLGLPPPSGVFFLFPSLGRSRIRRTCISALGRCSALTGGAGTPFASLTPFRKWLKVRGWTTSLKPREPRSETGSLS